MAKKKKFGIPEGQEQMPILVEPDIIKEIEEEHEVTDEQLEEVPQLENYPRKWVARPESKIKNQNYLLVKGSLETKDLRLKVVSIYDLSEVDVLPDAEVLGSEVDAYINNALGGIKMNAGMIAKSLGILTRGEKEA